MNNVSLDPPKTNIREIILGGQDGLVNVLGIILAVATATKSTKIVIIAGLAAAFAESISMAAVAYTSYKAGKEFCESEIKKEKENIRKNPEIERAEVEEIYRRKGFKGKLLKDIVDHITKNKKVWLDTMIKEELRIHPLDHESPIKKSFLVGISALIGSLIPLAGFFFLKSVNLAIILGVILTISVLFFVGVVKAKITYGSKIKQGLELSLIGIVAAFAGFLIGFFLSFV
jgi:vacuolar iron transporter family protein